MLSRMWPRGLGLWQPDHVPPPTVWWQILAVHLPSKSIEVKKCIEGLGLWPQPELHWVGVTVDFDNKNTRQINGFWPQCNQSCSKINSFLTFIVKTTVEKWRETWKTLSNCNLLRGNRPLAPRLQTNVIERLEGKSAGLTLEHNEPISVALDRYGVSQSSE